MKRIMTAALLSTALLAAPLAQAASSQDRAMATGAVVGATTGAVVGSNSNRAVEGAVFGAVMGTIAGAMIASYNEPVYVARPRHVERRVVHHYPPRARHHRPHVQKVVYVQPAPRRVARHAAANRAERHASTRSYGHRYGDRD